MDATRKTDGAFVSLKRINLTEHPNEIDIAHYFSSEPLVSDRRNHCARVLDVLEVPDNDNEKLLVMQLLRPWNNPRFKTYGEAVGFFAQIFQVRQMPCFR